MRSLPACIAGLIVLLLFATPAQAAISEDPFAEPQAFAAAEVPDEFVEETAFDNLVAPASIAFASDGRVFVGQLDGVIYEYSGVDDTTPRVYADLSENVAFHNDRGLMSMILDPQFTTGRPYMYVSYTYDAAIGQTAPRWNDICPDPPGAERDGCVVSGRLSKILPDGSEHPLITNDWCQQYPSHSLGDLKFGPDGALYVTAGDGASYTFADYGQDGSPTNPCGDPGGPVGGNMTPPTAEGGALRSQDVRTSADPTGLDGTLLRIDPDTAEPLPDNPGTGDKNARRIVAYGLRNPFRFAFRPGTTDAYVGDVGWLAWEELNRVPDTTSQVRNYGWPCYEGNDRQGGYEAADLKICRDLYTANTALGPLYTYNRAAKVATESCPVGGSSISGVTFYNGTTFPLAYRGAMFFADYSRNCIWVMFPNADGTPNPATRQVFADGASTPVDLEIGPGGDLYYANVGGGTIQRIRAVNPNQEPTAAFTTSTRSGNSPLHVDFDASDSTDPNNDPLSYAWDLDGDGEYDDSTAVAPSRTYTDEGQITVRLRVTDPSGASDTETAELTIGTPPVPAITTPVAGGPRFAVGDLVSFSGAATSADGSELPASRLRWTIDLNHCSVLLPASCHVHHMQDAVGVTAGSFSYPDHEYPSFVTLSLIATAPSGLTGKTSVRIDPKTVDLTFNSVPSGLKVAVGGEASATPFTRTVAQGSTVGVAAAPSQFLAGTSYDFGSWSDGGAAAHQLTAPATATALTTTYTETVCPVLGGQVGAWGFEESSGNVAFDSSGRTNTGTISGATRVAGGKYGGALSFDGSNDLVTIPDSDALDLSLGMTLEAWVNPAQLNGSWRTVAMKEGPGGLSYALYAADDDARPSGHVATPGDQRTTGPTLPLNTWSHLAVTFDGTTLRMYENGDLVSSSQVLGSITAGNGTLRIGGNAVWSEWFSGLIDEVKLYDRALSQDEVQVDSRRAIICSDGDPDTPVLSTSPASLSFSAQQGGAAPAAKTIDVANTGTGSLSWTATDDAAWLAVSPGSGAGAGTVTVTPDSSGLAPGTYNANVTVTAAGASGSPRIVPVSLTITAPPPGPALSVTPSSLTFTATEGGSSPADKTLTVANSGGGTLEWTVSDDAPWLSVSPASGTNGGTLTVSASIAGLSAGTRTATITVTAAGASGSPRTIAVSFTVDPAPPPPALAVSPASLSFSAVEGAATVETKAINVSNTGGGTLDFAASADVPWLNFNPASGSAPRTVSVTPSTAGLTAGTFTGTVTVTGPGGPKTVAVTFTVTAAPACPIPTGLVGAWGFDETSGTSVTDASPANNGGTISGATRTSAGRFGGALSFDGVNDWITIADANSLDLTTGMTLSAWVNPAVSGNWRTVALKENGGGLSYSLYANTDTAAASGHVSTPFESNTKSPAALPVGVWSHLAATYDGTTLRLLVNGAQVSSRAVSGAISAGTGALRIGGNAVWGEYYSGLIDEVRVYNRALGAAEVQADMAAPVTCSGGPAPAVLSASPASLSFSGTQGGANPAAKTIAIANTGGGQMNWIAAENASWLSIAPASGTNAGTVTVTPELAGLTAGTYTADVTVTAAGASGSPKTIPVTLTVGAPATPPGLVAAYGFEEASGTTTADGSGTGQTGTISGATRSATGRFGRALSFDGVNDWVTVPDANPLDLTTGLTMEAWVNPTATGAVWRTVLMKEQPGNLIYALYAGEGNSKPSAHIFTTSERSAAGPSHTPLNTWTHLGATWDGTTLRVFVNGTQVSSSAAAGTIRTSSGVLRIGGNGVWSEWFRGLIDEVRVYNRALTAAEIQADMTRPVSS